MTRKTDVTKLEDWTATWTFQEKLDKFWNLIEDMYEEEWRVQGDGSMILTVDSAMLERILKDNVATAWYAFGSFGGGQTEAGERFMIHRPEYLIGEYIIKGVYDASQRLVDGPREYFFIQGA